MKGPSLEECSVEQTSAEYMPDMVQDKSVRFMFSNEDSSGINASDIAVEKSGSESCSDSGEQGCDQHCQDSSSSLSLDALYGQCVELAQYPTQGKLNRLDEKARYNIIILSYCMWAVLPHKSSPLLSLCCDTQGRTTVLRLYSLFRQPVVWAKASTIVSEWT